MKIPSKHDIRRIRLVSSIVAGLILITFVVLIATSVANTDAPLNDNVGSSTVDPGVNDAVTVWNNQANIIYAVTQSVSPAYPLSAASVDVTSDSIGNMVTIEWTDGTYEQFEDTTEAGALGSSMGYVPNGDGIANNPSAFTPNAQISDQGMITLR